MIVLDWRDRTHQAPKPGWCVYCHELTRLLDDDGRYAHKVCVEARL